jgi:5-(carboxyamino)imidazole ribonucleotide mutase
MSFYPMTVNYWTMRGSGSYVEGKRNMLRTVAWVWFLCHRPGQTAFSPALEKDSVRVYFYLRRTGDEKNEGHGWRYYGKYI